MRAILVDDERLALRHLKQKLECDVGGVEVVETCMDPSQAVDMAIKHRPDVVFLDIQMPGINGLQLGEQLQLAVPDIEIIFVTGHDQYAIHAFKLYALDYILKPARTDRLQQTVQRLRGKLKANKETGRESQAPLICCFNQIRFQLPGNDSQTVKWRTSKAQELFAYLLHHRYRTVDRGTLIELLWPDFDVSRAAQQLYTTIYHIRQTLKTSGMGTVSIASADLEAGYRLTVGEVRIDTEEWEARVKQLGVLDVHTMEAHEHVLQLYQEHYLGDYEYLWAEHERERLRLLWLHHARSLSGFYRGQGRIQAAIQVNLRIQELFPDEEESYFILMKLYDALGDRGRVEEQYWLLTLRMERELESTVHTDIASWYQRWRQRDV
ncbi:Two-component response regulator, SAPR family, consists of REC, wHTH and BTAD domains [Paenibacillus tianmuensis]|uniref:Two-component response regulator, SAPR family, consists of REC, wHTH and BTAD domains n=1 Tax=Paenibacillus tianmuensis TaxID=624147 RepID=A0A1G4SNM6_9BACL|nr:response regulator [Paenibacillus tianmuensis]SCW70763.1 Two-component response regulator, SAPR family, consists of REC, wHTH and BTAD domains [Paenibacillus tianmuensis]